MINRFSLLIEALNSKEPISIVRLGNVEAHNMLIKGSQIYEQMFTNPGFFGNAEENKKWRLNNSSINYNKPFPLKI